MSYRDLVIATGTATFAGGVATYVNPRLPVGAICTANKNGALAANASVGIVCDTTVAGTITFTSINAAGAATAADVSTFSFIVLQPNVVISA